MCIRDRFTPCRPDGQERLTTAEYQISTQQPLLLSIDCKNSLIYIKKCDDKGIRVIREKAYPLSEVRLNEQGQIVFREQTEPAGQTAAQMRADGQSGQAKENAKGRERLEKGDTHEKESNLSLIHIFRPDGLYCSQQRFGMYRFHLTDPIRFDTDLHVEIQALGWRSEGRYLPLQMCIRDRHR